MPVAHDIVLLTIDPVRGTQLGTRMSECVVGGALLTDLVLAERCAVEEHRKEARFRLISNQPLGSPAHDLAMARMKIGKAFRGSALLRSLGQGMPAMVLHQLAALGVVAIHTRRSLRIFTTTRVEVLDTARRDWLAGAVRQVLVGEAAPDDLTGPLVGLLAACDRVREFVDPEQLPAAVDRARAIASGDWAASATRRAVIIATQSTTQYAFDYGAGSDSSDGGDGGGGGGD